MQIPRASVLRRVHELAHRDALEGLDQVGREAGQAQLDGELVLVVVEPALVRGVDEPVDAVEEVDDQLVPPLAHGGGRRRGRGRRGNGADARRRAYPRRWSRCAPPSSDTYESRSISSTVRLNSPSAGSAHRAERVAAGGERLVQLAVVPADRRAGAGAEAVPERLAERAVVEQDRARVVELVGERDAQLVRLLVGDRLEVLGLAPAPRRLGLALAVGVRLDDPRDVVAELVADALEHRPPAAVLDRVVQQRADRLGLAPAHLEHERRDAEQVRDVRDRRALAQLPAVVLGGQQQRAVEALGQHRVVGVGLGHGAPSAAVITDHSGSEPPHAGQRPGNQPSLSTRSQNARAAVLPARAAARAVHAAPVRAAAARRTSPPAPAARRGDSRRSAPSAGARPRPAHPTARAGRA